ncbi:MAG TPA: hypothetical protein VK915_14650 [Gaiellaceae bacterium]|nr:hypothetical protein [Gaiellaceae bacterium]
MLRLYWARNDGMSGHVFLGPGELEALAAEMAEQGITGWLAPERLAPGEHVPPGAVDFALARAADEPRLLEDATLWQDWLEFLRGAAANGGILVR